MKISYCLHDFIKSSSLMFTLLFPGHTYSTSSQELYMKIRFLTICSHLFLRYVGSLYFTYHCTCCIHHNFFLPLYLKIIVIFLTLVGFEWLLFQSLKLLSLLNLPWFNNALSVKVNSIKSEFTHNFHGFVFWSRYVKHF